jgi:HSP20 family protein
VKKEAVNIEFLDGQLVISGERPNAAAAAKEAAATATEANAADDNKPAVVAAEASAVPKFRRIETNYGAFNRSFRLPETVNVKAISAELTTACCACCCPSTPRK